MTRSRQVWRMGAMVGLCLALVACGGMEPAPKDAFYRLTPDNRVPADVGPAPLRLPVTLEVARFDVSGILSERPIAYTTDGRMLEQYNSHFWIETPPLLLQQALVARLQRAEVAELVVTPDLRVRADWEIRSRIIRFEQVRSADGGSSAAAALEVTVLDILSSEVLLQRRYEEVLPVTIGGDPISAAAATLGTALERIYGTLQADLLTIQNQP